MSSELQRTDESAEEPAGARRIPGEASCASTMPTSGAAAGTPTLDGVIREQERPLLRYATRIVRDHAAAQDVVQTAMIRLCRHWAMLSATPARIVPWLYRTVRNAAVDHIRREERRRRATEAMAREVTAPASPSPGPDERRRWVELQLEQLSTGEREVLVLRLEHGLSYRQIADVTGRTVGNVGCLLHNAVRRISAALKARGDL